jgi:hypothetical protein
VQVLKAFPPLPTGRRKNFQKRQQEGERTSWALQRKKKEEKERRKSHREKRDSILASFSCSLHKRGQALDFFLLFHPLSFFALSFLSPFPLFCWDFFFSLPEKGRKKKMALFTTKLLLQAVTILY